MNPWVRAKILISSIKMKLEDAFVSITCFLNSKWSGCILGPFYGLFIYWYISILVLQGHPFTEWQGTSISCSVDNEIPNLNNTVNLTFKGNTSTMHTLSTITKEARNRLSAAMSMNSSDMATLLNDSRENPSGYTNKYAPSMTTLTRYGTYVLIVKQLPEVFRDRHTHLVLFI